VAIGTRWYDIAVDPLLNESGQLCGAVHIMRDITDRRRADDTLHQSEEKHRILYESSRDAIMTLAPPSWRFTSGNPATVAMFRTGDEDSFVSCAPWQLSPELRISSTGRTGVSAGSNSRRRFC
jgi:PAS domain-containing protein